LRQGIRPQRRKAKAPPAKTVSAKRKSAGAKTAVLRQKRSARRAHA
jgi:hypothetical protein